MTPFETSLLAGGAALSLMAGAATAQFGLAPLNDAFGRQAAQADPAAQGQPSLVAAMDNIQNADYRPGLSPVSYATPPDSPKVLHATKTRVSTEDVVATVDREADNEPADETRDNGEASDNGRAPIVVLSAPAWREAEADHRDGQPADWRAADEATNPPQYDTSGSSPD